MDPTVDGGARSSSLPADRATPACRGWRSLQWWPTAVGLGFAAFVALDLFRGTEQGSDLAAVVAASGLVYLAAAALKKASAAWPVFFLSVIAITLAKMGFIGFGATWLLFGLAVLFVAYGLMRGVKRPTGGLPLQTIAMVGFGAVAATALMLEGDLGAYLVAAGLLGHAAWDVYHHWANEVVVRSLAEFCFVLDAALAVAIVIATLGA